VTGEIISGTAARSVVRTSRDAISCNMQSI